MSDKEITKVLLKCFLRIIKENGLFPSYLYALNSKSASFIQKAMGRRIGITGDYANAETDETVCGMLMMRFKTDNYSPVVDVNDKDAIKRFLTQSIRILIWEFFNTSYSYSNSNSDLSMAVVATDVVPGYFTDISLKPTN